MRSWGVVSTNATTGSGPDDRRWHRAGHTGRDRRRLVQSYTLGHCPVLPAAELDEYFDRDVVNTCIVHATVRQPDGSLLDINGATTMEDWLDDRCGGPRTHCVFDADEVRVQFEGIGALGRMPVTEALTLVRTFVGPLLSSVGASVDVVPLLQSRELS